MSETTRNTLLVIVIVLVIGSIVYLQKMKAGPSGPARAGTGAIAVATPTVATSTDGSTTTVAAIVAHSSNYAALAKDYPPAKELVSPDGYINTDGKPLTIGSLIGKKVILVDFWTYSCINCQRTIPYLNQWYQKYKDQGLEIIGVHTPEFDFEKVYANVSAAVQKFGIQYPVVMDSNYYTWDAYNNNYWPEEYLIDINGLVREHNIGEGNYAETEKNIQALLKERDDALGVSSASIPTSLVSMSDTVDTNSPETYFDWARNTNLGNGKSQTPGVQTFVKPPDADTELNMLYLGGSWNIGDQFAENSASGDTITFKYNATNVYFVASSDPGVTITVLRDGVPVTAEKGADVDANSQVNIKEPRLYKLISEPTAGTHTLEIIVNGPKLDAYTFTFG